MKISPEAAPQIRSVGPDRTIIEHPEDAILQHIKEQRNRIGRLEGEVPINLELATTILDIENTMAAVCNDVGVDIRPRLPNLSNYHAFDDREAYERALREIGLTEHIDTHAVGDFSKGIFLVLQDNPTKNESIIAHELSHFISAVRVRPEVTQTETDHLQIELPSTSGYSPQWPLWEEATSDLIATEIQRRRGEPVYLRYGLIDTIADQAIAKAATAHNIPVAELAATIVRGKLTGKQDGLRLIASALGKQQMQALRSIDYTQPSDDYYLQKALEADLDVAAQNIRAITRHEEIDLQFIIANKSNDAPVA